MRDMLQEWLGLKDLPRTGWVRSGVKEPESVAAHSWGMAILALHFAPKNLDLAKVLAMCIVHDLPEVRVGDLTPHDDVTNKAQLEASAMSELTPEWLGLFHEYESGNSEEARFVKQIDKLDMDCGYYLSIKTEIRLIRVYRECQIKNYRLKFVEIFGLVFPTRKKTRAYSTGYPAR